MPSQQTSFSVLFFILIFACFFLLFGFMIFFSIMLGLSAYNDSKARGNFRQATMWGFLIGFFNMIPGIIYLALRPNSFLPHADTERLALKARKQLKWGISLYVVYNILFFVLFICYFLLFNFIMSASVGTY